MPNDTSEVNNQIAELQLRVANLEMSVAPLTVEEVRRICWIAASLQPQLAPLPSIRIGNMGDGGYVIYPPDRNEIALSIGVGDEISADLQLIKEFNYSVYAFDPYVARPQEAPEQFVFHTIGLAAQSVKQPKTLDFRNLKQLLSMLPKRPDLAFIDIEGSEWDLGEEIESLAECKQVVLELHELEKIVDNTKFAKYQLLISTLKRTHTPIHVHGNNDGPTLRLSGAVWPGILEVTFLRNDLFYQQPTRPNFGPWPTVLDAPHSANRTDLYLDPFFGQQATYREI